MGAESGEYINLRATGPEEGPSALSVNLRAKGPEEGPSALSVKNSGKLSRR